MNNVTYAATDVIDQNNCEKLNSSIENCKLIDFPRTTSSSNTIVTENVQEDKSNKPSKFNKEILERLSKIQPEVNYLKNDLDSSKLFGNFYADQIRYNSTTNNWMFYNGKNWTVDTGGMRVSQLAKELTEHLYRYALSIADRETYNQYPDYANKLLAFNKRENMIRDSKDVHVIKNEELDVDLYQFNCQNGTFDLKTFEFKEHNPNDLISRISNVIYDPHANSQLFEKYIFEVMEGDPDTLRYLQKILGLSLTGDTQLETCWILYGASTRNGKSTLVETFSHMLGKASGYSLNMTPETLAQKKNSDSRQASGDIARLAGCRFLNASEPSQKMIFDAALLKTLLGKDTITARHLHQSEFEFIPAFKLFINTNYLPIIGDNTLFTSARINVIPFNKHFKPEEQDQSLKTKLQEPENISGIFNWCLEGLKYFYEEGAKPPKSVIEATEAYRNKSDKIALFISECLEPSEISLTGKDVYELYKLWCPSNGYSAENKGFFFSEFKRKNLMSARGTVDGKTMQNVIKNMQIKNEYLE